MGGLNSSAINIPTSMKRRAEEKAPAASTSQSVDIINDIYDNFPRKGPSSGRIQEFSNKTGEEFSREDTEQPEIAQDGDDMYIDIYFNESPYMCFDVTKGGYDAIQAKLLGKLRTGMFEEEFRTFPQGLTAPHRAGLAEENYAKNRFNSILPYDSSRVILKREASPDYSDYLNTSFTSCCSDYINASFIHGYGKKTLYIAAQGPKKNTEIDFWQMIWQEQVTHIVMVTNVMEGKKKKCEEYWPFPGSKRTFQQIEVDCVDQEYRSYYVIRILSIRHNNNEEERRVTQYHYTSWLDHSIPDPIALVDFWRTVRSSHHQQQRRTPLLVHCSAGVGRTGTYIALDIALDQAEKNATLDIAAIVNGLRKERCNMVQAMTQYVFLYEVVLEAYTSRHTRLSVDEFKKTFPINIDPHTGNARLENEYRILKKMKELNESKMSHAEAEKGVNLCKNRHVGVLPDDRYCVRLTSQVSGRNHYINAVYMPTFRNCVGCILTQLPLSTTIYDLWRLVDENAISTIACLDNIDEDLMKGELSYWPEKHGTTMRVGSYDVTMKSKKELGDKFTSYKLFLQHTTDLHSRDIQLLHFQNWTQEKIPANASQFLTLVGMLNSVLGDNPTHPILLQCFDGAVKCGLVCVMCNVIERLTSDREIDVFLAVRHMHTIRPQCVTSEVQYVYLHRVVQEYLTRMDIYENA